ncbi:arginine deiminase, partial [Pyrenophora tritici-repentis]
DALLFDDVLWVRRARAEHDGFADVLRERGVEVHLFRDLLEESLRCPPHARSSWTGSSTRRSTARWRPARCARPSSGCPPPSYGLARGRDDQAGVPGAHAEPVSVRFHVMDLDDFLINPLPNPSSPATPPPGSTTVCASTPCAGPPVGTRRCTTRRCTAPSDVRGGRLPRLVGGPGRLPVDDRGRGRAGHRAGAVLIGMSERTTPQAVEMLAHRLFATGSARTIVALDMPKRRAVMHLDTVMTMVDGDTFTQYAGLGMLRSYTIEPGVGERELKVTDHPRGHMHRAIAAALGLDSIRVLTATQDVHAAEREQWDDGCNVLAIEPGVVVAYERNATTHLPAQAWDRGHHHPRQRAGPGRGGRAV